MKQGRSMKVAIAGASGGIGGALLRLCQNDSSIETIYALSRQPVSGAKVQYFKIDYDDLSTFEHLSTIESIDALVIATGALTSISGPEKRIEQVGLEELSSLYRINAMGPILLTKALHHAFSKHKRSVCIALSAKVGSISDNYLGGWYSYRASKAALNMLFRSYAIEVSRTSKCIVSLYHPGTVATERFSLFQQHMDQSKIKTPEDVATALLQHINQMTEAHRGKLFDYTNQVIPF